MNTSIRTFVLCMGFEASRRAQPKSLFSRLPRIARLGCLALALCGAGTTVCTAGNFYVDPVSGNDSNDGATIASPFRTLERSRQAVAAVNSGMTDNITVYLRGGIHRLSATLTLGSADSGKNGFYVVYRNYGNEIPVVSGGVDLSGGWTLHDAAKNIYKKTGVSFMFRQLYVNGTTAIRARTPNRNNDDTLGPYLSIASVNSATKQAAINAADIANWSGLNDVEMVMNPHWYHYRGRISSFTSNATQALVTFRAPESNSIFLKGDGFWPNAPYFFENSLDFLDAEGEWFLDSATTTLYYKPRSGEDMATATIEAPFLDKLVQLAGVSSASLVRNIRFQGLTFTEAGWNGPSINGTAMTQGAREVATPVKQGAVTAQYADSLEFGFCTFRFLGLNAISYVKGVSGGSIHDCDFRWISANGIVVHDDGVANPAAGDSCHDIRIVNNSISRIGRDYSNGIGIVSYFVKSMLIADNEISFAPYMGTQTGGQTPVNMDAGMKDNILRNNFVHQVMQLHDDGGAYYTLSRQQGTHVADNWADNLQRSQWAGAYAEAGLYADNRSEFLTFENNALVNCATATFEQVTLGAQNNQWISNTTTADPAITRYAGRKANYIWPLKREAESMAVSGGSLDSGSFYSNDAGISFNGIGSISSSFNGTGGSYNINTAYVTGDAGAAGYRLLINGAPVDAWTAALTPAGTGLQVRHRITRAVALAAGDMIAIEATPASGTPAQVDYVEIYARQYALPAPPSPLTARGVSATGIALTWSGSAGADTYNIYRGDAPSGPFTLVATGVSGTTWADSGLVQDHLYYYGVAAVNAGGASAIGDVVGVTTDPSINTTQIEASADAYVQRGNPTTNFGGAAEIVVKNASTTSIQRKGYIRFDLTNHAPFNIPNASFQVVVSTWNQTSSWQVYGLKDGDAGESWVENTITWNNAPANITTTGDTLDSSKVTLLGTFSPSAVPPVGNVLELRSAALDAFLLADTNSKVTFILVRTGSNDLANSAVAARENATLAAPSLQFQRALLKTNWTGTASGNWSTGANWQAGTAPTSDYGAELQFFNGRTLAAGTLTATNDIGSPMVANRIVLAGSGTANTVVNLNGFPLRLEQYGGTHPAVLLSGGGAGCRYNVANDITLGDTTTFDASGNGTFVFNGPIGGAGGITKVSSGSTLILAGNNSYTGPTTISAGTLVIDGRHSSGAVTVSAGAVLAGSGNLSAATAIGGTLAPGDGVGTINFANTLSFSSTGRLQWELGGNSPAGDRAVAYGGISVATGAQIDVVLNSSGSSVNFLHSFWRTARPFPALTSSAMSGAFALGSVTADSGGRPASTYGNFTLQNSTAGATLLWTPIPGFPVIEEPTVTLTNPSANIVSVPAVALALRVTATITGGNTTVTWTQDSGPAAATFENPSAADTKVSFPSAGTYVLRCTASNMFGTASTALTVNVSAAIATAEQAWRWTYFGFTTNSGAGADTSDPDGDGENNLIEFATAQDPNAATRVSQNLVANGAYLEFAYTRSKAAIADGLKFTVEWSDSLSAGSWSTAGIANQNPPPIMQDARTETVRILVPAGAGNRFVRLKVAR